MNTRGIPNLLLPIRIKFLRKILEHQNRRRGNSLIIFMILTTNVIMYEKQTKQTMAMSKAYAVLYDSSDHLGVLTQMVGSLWPKVFPWCLINACVMALLSYLKHRHSIHFEVSGQGHSYISVVVAFLLVARVNMSLARFNESRTYLSAMYRETSKSSRNLG